jgi:hypothetical protein
VVRFWVAARVPGLDATLSAIVVGAVAFLAVLLTRKR